MPDDLRPTSGRPGSWVKTLFEGPAVRTVLETYAARVASMGLGLAATILTARSLGAEGRGWLVMALTVVVTGSQLASLGLPAANAYFGAKNPQERPGLLGNSLLVSGGLGTILVLVVYSASSRWPELLPLPGLLRPVALVYIPIQLALLMQQHMLISMDLVRQYNMQEVVLRTTILTAIGVLAWHDLATPGKILGIYLVATIPILVWTSLLLFREVGSSPRLSWPLLRRCTVYGFKIYLGGLMIYLLLNFDVFLVQTYLGPEQNGLYNVPVTIGTLIMTLPLVLQMLLLPRLSRLPKFRDRWPATRRAVLGTALYAAVVCLAVSLVPGPLVRLLFGPEFLPAVPALQWLLPGIFFLSVANVGGVIVGASGQPAIALLPGMLAFLTNLVLNLLLLPRYGIVGAAMASTSAYFLLFVTSVLFIAYYLRHPEAIDEPTESA